MNSDPIHDITRSLKELFNERLIARNQLIQHIRCIHEMHRGMETAILALVSVIEGEDTMKTSGLETVRKALDLVETLRTAQKREMALESHIIEHTEAVFRDLGKPINPGLDDSGA
jgi:hypothetical protein